MAAPGTRSELVDAAPGERADDREPGAQPAHAVPQPPAQRSALRPASDRTDDRQRRRRPFEDGACPTDADMIGSRMPVGDVAQRVVRRRSPSPAAAAARAGRRPTTGTGSRTPAGRSPGRRRRGRPAARSGRRSRRRPTAARGDDHAGSASTPSTPPWMCAPKISPSGEEPDGRITAQRRRAREAARSRSPQRDRGGERAGRRSRSRCPARVAMPPLTPAEQQRLRASRRRAGSRGSRARGGSPGGRRPGQRRRC